MRPQGEVRGWGVFAHGFTLGKDCPAASRICKQLASEGIGMLRFDNLGLGHSEGDWGDGSFSHKVDDTVRAVEFMNESGREVRLLVGHSFGARPPSPRRTIVRLWRRWPVSARRSSPPTSSTTMTR